MQLANLWLIAMIVWLNINLLPTKTVFLIKLWCQSMDSTIS